MLQAITLYDPWGTLMSLGAKTNETRPRRTGHRGDIAIHVAKTPVAVSHKVMAAATAVFKEQGLVDWPWSHFGCIVAVVDLYEVQPADRFETVGQVPSPGAPGGRLEQIPITASEYLFGNYEIGRWVYRTRNLRRLKQPVHARGCQAVHWTVPLEVEAQVRAQI